MASIVDLGVISSDQVFENLSFSYDPINPSDATKYKFTLKEDYVFGATLSYIYTSSGMTTNAMVSLYDELDMQVSLDPITKATFLSAGTYYISCSTPMSGVSYTLSLDCDKLLCSGNNSIDTAYDLGTISGTNDFEGIYLEMDVESYFKFTLTEDSVLLLSATYASVTFYDENGTSLSIMSAANGAEFAAGTYYVRLLGSGAVDMVFTQSKVLCSGNDSIENAYDLGVISGTKDVDGIYLSSMETEYFKFTLSETSILSLAATTGSGMSVFPDFYDAQGNYLHISSSGTGPKVAEFAAGTYYVSLGGSAGAVDMVFTQSKVLASGNDSIESAYDLGAISGEKSFSGIYLSSMETEYYKFTLSENSIVEINPVTGSSSSTYIPSMTLYDANGKSLGMVSGSMAYPVRELSAGTYYVSMNTTSSGLEVELEFNQSKVLASGNDSIESAYDLGVISGEKSFSGIYVNMEAEYYKFTLSENSIVDIGWGDSMYTPSTSLYDVNGEKIGGMFGANSPSEIELAAGTYYISLYSQAGGEVELEFNQTKALAVGNNSIATAYDLGVISGTKDIDGVYLEMMKNEYFKFTLSEASVLSLSATTGSGMSVMSTTFYDAEGNNMNIMSYGSGPVSAEFAAGTYYVSLGNGSMSGGAVDVVFTQSKILCTGNDSIENAYDLGTIAGKKSFDGIFRVEMEIAEYYKFTIAEDSTVLLSVPAIPEYGGMNFMVDVYDEEQNVLMGETDFETGTLKIDLAAGTYYVSLAGGNYGFISLDFNVIEKDYDAPELPCTFSATVNDFDVTLDWDDVADKGEAGVKGYYVRYGSSAELEGEGFFVSESSCALEDLCVGKWYYQVKAVDNVDNASDWSEVQNFEVRYPGPSNLQGGADGLSWNVIPGVEGYIVEYSKDYFATVFRVECCSNGVDSFALPEGYWQWRVSAIDGDYSDGNYFSTAKDNAPQKYISVANDKKDIFFANAKGTWNSYFNAIYQGDEDIEAAVSLAGKNKIVDVFAGSDDANMLVLTDDACGDALFLDDIYSAFGDAARLSRINEIRAGAGDDIIDLTSSRFAVDSFSPVVYGGDGNDTIWANNGSNIIFGDAGNDNIIGGNYNDVIVGGIGNDTMFGGGGYDIFCFGGDWGNDTVVQLYDGTAILWFEDDNGEWDELTRTYTAGENSVTFFGEGSVFVLSGPQGDIDNFNDLYSLGCFSEVASDKIFDDDNKGILA